VVWRWMGGGWEEVDERWMGGGWEEVDAGGWQVDGRRWMGGGWEVDGRWMRRVRRVYGTS